MNVFYSVQYMKVIFTTKNKDHVHSVRKRDYEKCIIYDRLLKRCFDVTSGHIYCPQKTHLHRDAQLTFWRRNYSILILAHPVYKM